MSLDPRTPVIVGVGQYLQKPDDPLDALEPVAMMAEVVRRAAEGAGGDGMGLVQAADSVRVVSLLSWHYADPGARLASLLGARPRHTAVTTTGGNSPQMLVNATARAIQAGELDIAVIAGAEALYTRRRAREHKVRLPWTTMTEAAPGAAPAEVIGDDRQGVNDIEMAQSVAIPTQIYPVFENALRAAAGESIEEHQVRVSELWARFSSVAAGNEYAWSRTPWTPEEIRTVTAENRMIGFPYPKLMNANIDTDQAAGLLLCSVEAASRFGVPRDRWVFPLAGAEAHDHWWVSSRSSLTSSPAIRLCGQAAFAGVSIDDVAHVDLYSCFPCAVQIGAAELGLGLDSDRHLTVTGGLAFAGGPGNNYSTHAVASMVSALRQDPGSVGLVSALGWYITKHAIGLYSTTPGPSGFQWRNVQDEVDRLPMREFGGDVEGPVTIESYTVMHERDGSPALGIVAALTDDGVRSWGNVRDSDVLGAMVREEFCGRAAVMHPGGAVEVA